MRKSAVKTNPIEEARRYTDNAQEILSEKAGKEGRYYSDPKYVRMAGNTAWNGVLIALEAIFNIKAAKGKGVRPDYKDYQAAITRTDKKLLTAYNVGYETLHKHMGYDGTLSYETCAGAIKTANEIIDWCESRYMPAN